MFNRSFGTILFLAALGAALLFIPARASAATSPPQLLSVTTAKPDGAYGAGSTIDIQAAFDTAVAVDGVPSISLNSGGTANYVAGSGTSTLLFSYSPTSGQSSSDLDLASGSAFTGTVTDSVYGTAANLSIALPALSASSHIVIDTTPPTGTVVIKDGAVAIPTGGTLPLTLTASDNVSAFSNMKVRFRDYWNGYGEWQPLSTNMTYPNNYGGGMGYIYAQFMDEAGNISAEVSDAIVVDFYNPTGSLAIDDNAAGTASLTVTVAYTANDQGGSYPVTVDIWSSDDATHQVVSNVALGSSGTLEYALADADGVKTIYMQVTDAAGRTSSVYSKQITLDRVAPAGTVSMQSEATLVNTAAVTLSVGRSGTDATSMRFSDDGEAWSDWEAYASTKSYTLPAGDGLKTIYMQLMDVGGNISPEVSTSVTLDTVAPNAPVITLSTTEPATEVTVTIDYPEDAAEPHEYQLWGENRSTYSGPFVLTSNHTISAYARDMAGNESASEPAYVTNIDQTPPSGTLSFKEGTATSTTAVTLLLTDNGTGATEMQFSDDNSVWTNWEAFSTTKAYDLPSGEGVHTVYAHLKDAVGNIGTISASVAIDATPPSGTLSFKEGTVTSSASVTLLLDDGGTGAAQMQFSDDNETWSEWEAYSGTKAYTLPLGDGSKTVYVQLKDAADNVSAGPISATTLLDSTPPAQPTLTPSTTAPAQSVSVTIEYPGDAVETTYQINDGASTLYTGPFELTSNAAITAFAKDGAGNESSATLTVDNIDTTLPSGTLSFKEGTVTSSASVTLLPDDGGTGAAQMRFSDDNEAWSGWEAYSGTKAYTLSSGDGSKTVYVQLKDAAGNVGAGPINATILLDSTPPAQPTLTPSTTMPAQSVTIAIGYAGDVTEATYQINEGAATPYTGPFELTSNATITAFAKDGAGNESSAALAVNNIDTQPPSGTILMNGGASVTNTVYVTLTLNDGDTGATQMRFSVDHNTWSDWEAYNASKAFALPAGDGGKTVYAQLRDAAGNVSNATISATIQLVTIVPETAHIVSAVTDSTGTMLSIRFDKAMQPNAAIEGLSLSGTSSVVTSTYAALPGSKVFVLQLSQAVNETNDVTLNVGDGVFHGALGEQVPGQSVTVLTPYSIATLKASVAVGESAFGVDDILQALNRQIDVVGEPVFDQEDVQFWLGLIEPRFIGNQSN